MLKQQCLKRFKDKQTRQVPPPGFYSQHPRSQQAELTHAGGKIPGGGTAQHGAAGFRGGKSEDVVRAGGASSKWQLPIPQAGDSLKDMPVSRACLASVKRKLKRNHSRTRERCAVMANLSRAKVLRATGSRQRYAVLKLIMKKILETIEYRSAR